jgi:hypothetical protein
VPAEQDVVLGPGLGEHPAHHVDAHPVRGVVELDHVARALVHRAAILGIQRRVAEDLLEGRLAAEDRRHGEHRVEPVAELAGEALSDEVGREPLPPVIGILAVVERRERHDPGIEPRVADVADPLHRRAATGAGDLDGVDVGPVRGVPLELIPSLDGTLLELIATADDLDPTARRAVIDRQSEAPVALLADHPVVHVVEPVELTLVPEIGDPADLVDDLHDLVAQAGVDLLPGQGLARLLVHRAHVDEPLVDEAKDEGRPASPAMRVAVGDGLEPVETALALQVLDDRVGHVADVGAGQVAEIVDEDARLVERGDDRQPERLAQLEVLGAAARGDVDDAGPLLLADLVPRHDDVLVRMVGVVAGAGSEGLADRRQVVERAGITPARHLVAGDLLEDLEVAIEGGPECPLGEPVLLATLADPHVAQ